MAVLENCEAAKFDRANWVKPYLLLNLFYFFVVGVCTFINNT